MLKTFEDRLENIKDGAYKLAFKVIEANKISVEAIKLKDEKLFDKAEDELISIEEETTKLDNLIITTLALHSPEARDLRELASYLKITNELVRATVNTRNFIETFIIVTNTKIKLNSILEYSIPLHLSAIMALESATEMIKTDDKEVIEDLFHKTVVEENKTDDLYAMIEKNLLKMITNKNELSKDYFCALSSIRKLEKIADNALSIAYLLNFAKIGGELKFSH